jgi:glycosyltransferase involved in cell wall biosynthesis
MNQPLISIISPTYNHEKYIAECIESVINQSYSNWEMLIMDDGSTDKTGKIAQEYVSKDSRIKYYFQDNIGVMRLRETYNKAVSFSKGKYIAILECDDTWFPNKLKTQVEAMETNEECVLSWSYAYNSREDINDILKTQPDPEQSIYSAHFQNIPNGIICRSLIFGSYVPALTIFIRASTLKNIGGFQGKENLGLVDMPTILHLSWHGSFCFHNEILGTYRRQSQQATKKSTLLLLEATKEYVYNYFNSLSNSQKNLLGLTVENVRKKFYSTDMAITFAYARACLIRKEFRNASSSFMTVLLYPNSFNLKWRILSIIGIAHSLVGYDFEWMAKLVGKRYYN